MAYEDFTTYTEIDEGDDITVTTNKVEWDTMTSDVTSRVFKDFGVGHFGNVEHLVEIEFKTSTVYGGSAFWIISNALTDLQDMFGNKPPGLVFYGMQYEGSYQFRLHDCESGNGDIWNGSVNTLYYCTVERAGTSGTVKIYSDSDRTDLLTTLGVNCTVTTLRYLYAACSTDSGHSERIISGFSQNFDLQEAPPPPPGQFMTPQKYW